MNPLHRTAIAAGFGLALLVPGVAHAHVPTVVPGASCDHVGDKGQHDGHDYVCQQKRGDRCPIWHSVPQPGASTTWTHAPCPCESTSPTASPTATPTPSHTPTPTASPSGTAVIVATPSPSTAPSKTGSATPVADTGQLPVTGSPVVAIVTLGCSLLVGGAFILAGLHRWRRRTA